MSKQTELVPASKQPLPLEVSPEIGVMLRAVIDKGVTPENVAALDKLCSLYERMQDKDAERAFAQAFASLQGEMPRIKATKPVPSADGSVRFRFAPFEEIMEQVQPLLVKHGFTVSFSMDFKEGRLIETCTLMHIGGHSRNNSFAVRIGQGPPRASEAQADGAAATYAKRFALCNALNIVVAGLDTDARAEGASITKEQAENLRDRVHSTGSDEAAFLKYAKAASYEEIPSSMWAALDANLKRKEATR